MEREDRQITGQILDCIRYTKAAAPLLHMIPNDVTAGFCADAISAVGGRPLMAVAKEEMREIVSSADGLTVNLGQPSEEKYLACKAALTAAAESGIFVTLDPVGAGASEYRRQMIKKLLEVPWSGVVKGNEAEVHTILTGCLTHTGVDSPDHFETGQNAEAFLRAIRAQGRSIILAVTGQPDTIFWLSDRDDRLRQIRISHSRRRPFVLVGTGCVAGALLGTFLAAEHMRVQEKKESGQETDPAFCTEQAVIAAAAALSLVAYGGEQQAGQDGQEGQGREAVQEKQAGQEGRAGERRQVDHARPGGQIGQVRQSRQEGRAEREEQNKQYKQYKRDTERFGKVCSGYGSYKAGVLNILSCLDEREYTKYLERHLSYDRKIPAGAGGSFLERPEAKPEEQGDRE